MVDYISKYVRLVIPSLSTMIQHVLHLLLVLVTFTGIIGGVALLLCEIQGDWDLYTFIMLKVSGAVLTGLGYLAYKRLIKN